MRQPARKTPTRLSRAIKPFRIERTCRRSEMRKNLRQTFTISPLLPPLLFCIEGTRGKFSWLAHLPTSTKRKEQMHKILPSTTSVKEERRVLRMFSPTKPFLPPSILSLFSLLLDFDIPVTEPRPAWPKRVLLLLCLAGGGGNRGGVPSLNDGNVEGRGRAGRERPSVSE